MRLQAHFSHPMTLAQVKASMQLAQSKLQKNQKRFDSTEQALGWWAITFGLIANGLFPCVRLQLRR